MRRASPNACCGNRRAGRVAGGSPPASSPWRSRCVPEPGISTRAGASYQEVFEILPTLLSEDAIGEIPLLGGHAEGGAAKGNLEQRSPVLFDIVRRVVE